MIDLNNLEKYTENNRIEAKKALGGLPHSIWETYSAFANTLGGVILLGVEEYKDKTLHTVNLPDPGKLVGEFWAIVNDPEKTSVNILTGRHVRIEEVNGDRIIVIEVPRAQRYDKPVYVNGDPVGGAYRRNGEGDYRCTKEELRAMLRDAKMKTQDMLLMENMDLSVFCPESIRSYRERLALSGPKQAWETDDDETFLVNLGAMGIGEDGRAHPTSAGLLMFGCEQEIRKEYPDYRLDYREEHAETRALTDRLVSSSGDWSGNIFDFYFRVCGRLHPALNTLLEAEAGPGADSSPIHGAVAEALANCLINADYYGRRGLVIVKKQGLIIMSNPGDFRVDLAMARSGGLSDPRNGVIMKMFSLIDVSDQTGSGIPSILYAWKQQGWGEPTIIQSSDPSRIQMLLPLTKSAESGTLVKNADKNALIETAAMKELIISYLTERVTASAPELCGLLNLRSTRVTALLTELIAENIISARDEASERTYKLKA